MFGRRSNSTATDTAPEQELAAVTDAETAPPPPPIDDVVQLFTPKKERPRKSVEQLLLERGQVTEEQLAQAKQVQSQTPGKQIAQILLTMNAASEAQILSAQAECLGLAFEVPDKTEIDAQAFGLLTPEYIRKQFVLPLRFDGKALVIGMADPANVFLLDEVKRKTKRDCRVVVTPVADINRLVEQM